MVWNRGKLRENNLKKFISEDENLRLKKLVSQAIANERIPWKHDILKTELRTQKDRGNSKT